MANYVDASVQTVWAGLAKRDNIRPDILLARPDTTTPPDEMIADEKEEGNSHLQPGGDPLSALIERRKGRPGLVARRISLPASELDDEILPSPPPTKAILSPLPAANRLHAGHTPLYPQSLSPNMDKVAPPTEQVAVIAEPEQAATPDLDEGLTGPLVLPSNPVDGAEDTIALEALTEELEKVARDQERFSKLKDAPEPEPKPKTDAEPDATELLAGEIDLPISRKGSRDSRKSDTDVEVVDGIILKTPPLNFGIPIGQAPRRRSEHEEP